MTERETFLRQIAANRDDDSLRLIYADWLEDHGNTKAAEFIRLQILLATLDPKSLEHKVTQDLSVALQIQTGPEGRRELEAATGLEIIGLLPHSLPTLSPRGTVLARYTRGFISHLIAHYDDWKRFAECALGMVPIESVEFLSIPSGPIYYQPDTESFRSELWPGIAFTVRYGVRTYRDWVDQTRQEIIEGFSARYNPRIAPERTS